MDPLTGLGTRDALQRDLAARAQAGGAQVIVGDIVNFVLVNAAAGHVAADAVLINVAQRIHRALPIDSTCYRVGANTFVLVGPPDTTSDLTDVLTGSAHATFHVQNLPGIHVCFTCGSSSLPPGGDPVDALRHADRACFNNRKPGMSPTWDNGEALTTL